MDGGGIYYFFPGYGQEPDNSNLKEEEFSFDSQFDAVHHWGQAWLAKPEATAHRKLTGSRKN